MYVNNDLNFRRLLLQSYRIASEDLEYSTQVTFFWILLSLLELDRSIPHSLSLYWKACPGHTSKIPRCDPRKKETIWGKGNNSQSFHFVRTITLKTKSNFHLKLLNCTTPMLTKKITKTINERTKAGLSWTDRSAPQVHGWQSPWRDCHVVREKHWGDFVTEMTLLPFLTAFLLNWLWLMLDWVLIVAFTHHSLDDTLFLHLFIGPFVKHDGKLMTERHSVFSEKYALC